MMKKNRINVFLIKENIAPECILTDLEDSGAETVPLSDEYENYYFYVRPQDIHIPGWVSSFFGDSLPEGSVGEIASVSAILIVPVNVTKSDERQPVKSVASGIVREEDRQIIRYFALTFGYGRSLLNPSMIEERFGLKCVLNTVKNNSLRMIQSVDVSGSAKRSSEQLPREGQIDAFALDVERNLLNKVTAKSDEDSLLSGMITGGDSLTVAKDLTITDLASFLGKVFDLYQCDDYKKNFDWVDNIAAVKSPELKKKLWEAAIREICSYDTNEDDIWHRLWMAVPVVLNWDGIEGFQIDDQRDESGKPLLHQDILLKDIVESFRRRPLTSIEQLRSKKIHAISTRGNDDVAYTWTADKCLVGDLTFEGKSYCISDGKWYEIETDYLKRINSEFECTPSSGIPFIPYLDIYKDKEQVPEGSGGNNVKVSHEARYNYEIQRQLNTEEIQHYLLMDRKTISYGGGRSAEEFCDLLTDFGQRIHVKRCSGSAAMSHLFNQGLVSASLEKDAGEFVRLVDDKIMQIAHSRDTSLDNFLLTQNSIKEVVFAVVPESRYDHPDLPFFSKVAFASVKKQLKRMGIETYFNWIPRKKEESDE